MQTTYFVAEVKSQMSTIYEAYISPASNKAQLNAILAYSSKHTMTHIAMFIAGKNDMRRGIVDQGKLSFMKRLMFAKAISRGVIPVLTSVLR